jgi:hypothetical protein
VPEAVPPVAAAAAAAVERVGSSEEPAAAAVHGLWDGMLLLPELGASEPTHRHAARPAPATAAEASGARLIELLEGDALHASVAMQAAARAQALGLPPPPGSLLTAAVAARQFVAGHQLLQLDAPATLLPLCRALNRRDAVGAALRDAACQHRGLRARLRRALHGGCDEDLVCAAVRLGDPDLDRRALARCRRDDALADHVAAACAAAACGADRVGFLLDLWAQMTRAGDDEPGEAHDDVTRATLWFAPLPPAATEALLQRLQATRSGEVRRRVFLALAARGDAAALDRLLAWVDSPNATAAALAAYALGRYEARLAPRLLAALPATRRPELLWTAIASQGHVRLRPALVAAGLSTEDAEVIATGGFHPDQIDAVAALLRGRTVRLPHQP